MERADYLVLGGQGQLGRELVRQLGPRARGLGRAEVDLADSAAVRAAVAGLRPRVVVNCAAYTAVDRAEDDPEAAMRINAVAVGELAAACRDADARLVHFSSDYVFGGDATRRRPYREDDEPAPQGRYAVSKLEGERAAGPDSLVIRTCGLYGRPTPGHGGNFVETMLRVGPPRGAVRVVDDQRCTPSYVADVAAAALWLVERGASGLYHVVNAGDTTWCEFARAVFRIAGLPVDVEPITTEQYGAKAPRPAYSVLSTAKYLAAGGPSLRSWEDALAAYLNDREQAGPEASPPGEIRR